MELGDGAATFTGSTDSGAFSQNGSPRRNASGSSMGAQPSWKTDKSFRIRSSVPELDSDDFNNKCLMNHLLQDMEATMEGWKCDLCLKAIDKGKVFRGCQLCFWGKCEDCFERRTGGLLVGQYVEAIHDLELDGEKIEASTRGTVLQSWEHGATIDFILSACRTKQFHVPVDKFTRLKLLDVGESSSNVRLIIGSLIIGGLFVFGIFYGKRFSFLLGRLVSWCRTLGWGAPVLIFAVCSILPVIMLPVFPMMALSGPLFTEMHDRNALVGGTIAFVSVFSGLWVGSVVAFALGKTLFRDFAAKASRESKYLQKINCIIDAGGTKIVLMARSLPILPAEVFDYACALTNLQIWQYAIGCLGSALPVAFWTFSSAQATVAAHSSSSHDAGRHLCLIALNVVILVVLSVLIVHTIKSQELEDIGASHPRQSSRELVDSQSPRGASPLNNRVISTEVLLDDHPDFMSARRSFASIGTMVSNPSTMFSSMTMRTSPSSAFGTNPTLSPWAE